MVTYRRLRRVGWNSDLSAEALNRRSPPSGEGGWRRRIPPVTCLVSRLNQYQSQLAADDLRCALQAFDRGAAIIRVKQTIDLRAARFHQEGHALLGDLPFLHFARKLTRNH